jgi:hypothetical protein
LHFCFVKCMEEISIGGVVGMCDGSFVTLIIVYVRNLFPFVFVLSFVWWSIFHDVQCII